MEGHIINSTSFAPDTTGYWIVLIIGCCVIIAIIFIIKKIFLKKPASQVLKVDADPAREYTLDNSQDVGNSTNGLQSSAGQHIHEINEKAPHQTEIIAGKSSISQSLEALVEKYSFSQVILATTDGLMLASSSGADTMVDAAKYSEIFARDPLAKTPGIIMFGIEHRGSPILCIIRTGRVLTQELESVVKKDTKDILNWWI